MFCLWDKFQEGPQNVQTLCLKLRPRAILGGSMIQDYLLARFSTCGLVCLLKNQCWFVIIHRHWTSGPSVWWKLAITWGNNDSPGPAPDRSWSQPRVLFLEKSNLDFLRYRKNYKNDGKIRFLFFSFYGTVKIWKREFYGTVKIWNSYFYGAVKMSFLHFTFMLWHRFNQRRIKTSIASTFLNVSTSNCTRL